MELSADRFSSLIDAVRGVFGEEAKICQKKPVSGGDINRAYMLILSDGRKVFMKENAEANLDFFAKEIIGLAAIRESGAISVPEVYAYGVDEGRSFLMMEAVIPGKRVPDFYEDFGKSLYSMHSSDCGKYSQGGLFGFPCDNYIGAGYQENTPEAKWVDFFRNRRLVPQIRRAEHYFDRSERAAVDRLIGKLDDLLVEPPKPALLHGDLCSGNFIEGSDGRAWLIDPAAYVGHPEADIAMTELFGGFPRSFYEGYYSEAVKASGYEDRRDIYNLYHLLNHLNMFGSSYLGAVLNIVRRYA